MAQLEPGVSQFIMRLNAQTIHPLYTLSPNEARNVLESVQNIPVNKQNAYIENQEINGVKIAIYRPENYNREILPIIIYFHGGGWILGSQNSHDRLLREITNGTHSAVIYVNYSLAPEAIFPTQLEQGYTITKYLVQNASSLNLDGSRVAVMGDSVGGNMATVIAMQGDIKIGYQVLFYPVTDANFNTLSYQQFANGPWLTRKAMEWFWNAYAPDPSIRNLPTVSPLRASLQQLARSPPALIITDENDVLRDEGEAYAHKLMEAGVSVVSVRYLGMIHDFVLLNPIADRAATRSAIDLANQTLFKFFWRT